MSRFVIILAVLFGCMAVRFSGLIVMMGGLSMALAGHVRLLL